MSFDKLSRDYSLLQSSDIPIDHYDWLNVSKGIGIMLVIMGHTVFPLHEAISLFHMPLFFFISGLTLKESTEPGLFLKKKISRIAVPYLFYAITSFLMARSISYEGNVFNGPIWFLHSLFLGIIIAYFTLGYLTTYKSRVIFTLCLAIYGYVVVATDYSAFPYDLSFDRTLRSLVYIMIGFLSKGVISKHIAKAQQTTSRYWLYFLSFLSVYGFLVYISVFKMNAHGGFLHGDICRYNIFVFYATSLTGILTVIYLSSLISSSKLFKWLGENSLTIMCVHYPFLQWWNPTIASNSDGLLFKGIIAIVTYIVTVLICVPFVYLFKKYLPTLTGYK